MNSVLKSASGLAGGAAKGATKLSARAGKMSKAGTSDMKARAAKTAGAVGLGALTTWFMDPQSGKRRRHTLRDRTFGLLRRGAQSANRQARYAAGQAQGAAARATPGTGRSASRFNDPALARKVETEIFRDESAPKGSVDVNVENGVVYLRGEVKRPEEIESLGEAARKVKGVKEVKNLLHLPHTPAKMKSD